MTVQYRLGALGWLADDAFGTSERPAGNYGLLDEMAALKWVRTNIGNFGGDPKRLLVFGESAGAVDTCLLLASPLAAGLYSRALIESGACVAADATTAKKAAIDFQDAAGCTSVASVAKCLRALPLDTVLRTLPGTIDLTSIGRPRYGPYVDGRVLPGAPLELIGEGNGNHVPVIVGSNEDESALFLRQPVPTADAYASALTVLVGPGAHAEDSCRVPGGPIRQPTCGADRGDHRSALHLHRAENGARARRRAEPARLPLLLHAHDGERTGRRARSIPRRRGRVRVRPPPDAEVQAHGGGDRAVRRDDRLLVAVRRHREPERWRRTGVATREGRQRSLPHARHVDHRRPTAYAPRQCDFWDSLTG